MRGMRMRGISDLIAVALLIAAAIVIGGLVYHFVGASTSAIAQKPDLQISASASYVGTTAYVQITVRNVGGAAANITKVTVDGVDVSSQLGIPSTGYLLQPGQVLQKVITLNNLKSGQHIIVVTLSNGEQFSATFTS